MKRVKEIIVRTSYMAGDWRGYGKARLCVGTPEDIDKARGGHYRKGVVIDESGLMYAGEMTRSELARWVRKTLERHPDASVF